MVSAKSSIKKTRKRITIIKSVPRGIGRARRAKMYNPSPVFTESFVSSSVLTMNSGFVLAQKISDIPQLAQYSALYTKYRIRSIRYLLLPTFQGGSDENQASFNNGSSQPYNGSSRIVYSIQDSPNQTAPASEAIALEDNGCKIRMMTNKLTISTRPSPQILDTQGNYITLKGKYLNFDQGSGLPNPLHYGVCGYISQAFGGAAPLRQTINVYVKMTFQVSDPR